MFVDGATRIQIIDTIADLPTADKEQGAAFIVRLFHLFHLTNKLKQRSLAR